MKYKKLTPNELAQRTINDIERRRKRTEDGKKQALMHCIENRNRVQKRLEYGKH